MRFLVLSDLHLEFGADYIPPEGGYDAVILAGDTAPGIQGVTWAQKTWPDVPVIYLLGNHEYYGFSWDTLAREIKMAAAPNIKVLCPGEVVLGGVRILGTTLWTDMRLGARVPIERWIEGRMNDYVQIKSAAGRGGVLTAPQTTGRHRESVEWLQDRLAESFDGPTLIVTHHAPSIQGCGWRQRGALAAAYASDMDELVAKSGASMWIHGHTHVAKAYKCGAVPVLSNARGYPGENSVGWRADRIVTVEAGEVSGTGAVEEEDELLEGEILDDNF